MTKDQLVKKIKELLKTNSDVDFVLNLKKSEIETLIACIRDRVDQERNIAGSVKHKITNA